VGGWVPVCTFVGGLRLNQSKGVRWLGRLAVPDDREVMVGLLARVLFGEPHTATAFLKVRRTPLAGINAELGA
jgi:hypothetical protein